MFYFSRIFKNITFSLKKSTSSEKNVIVEGELDCIDTDNIRNLEDSPRLVFIIEECVTLIMVNDGRQLERNIIQKNSGVLQ